MVCADETPLCKPLPHHRQFSICCYSLEAVRDHTPHFDGQRRLLRTANPYGRPDATTNVIAETDKEAKTPAHQIVDGDLELDAAVADVRNDRNELVACGKQLDATGTQAEPTGRQVTVAFHKPSAGQIAFPAIETFLKQCRHYALSNHS